MATISKRKYLLVLSILCTMVVYASPVYYPITVSLKNTDQWQATPGPSGHVDRFILKQSISTNGLRFIEFNWAREAMDKPIGTTVYLNYLDKDNYSYCRFALYEYGMVEVYIGQVVSGEFQDIVTHSGPHPDVAGVEQIEFECRSEQGVSKIRWKIGEIYNEYSVHLTTFGGRLGYRVEDRLRLEKITLAYDSPQESSIDRDDDESSTNQGIDPTSANAQSVVPED